MSACARPAGARRAPVNWRLTARSAPLRRASCLGYVSGLGSGLAGKYSAPANTAGQRKRPMRFATALHGAAKAARRRARDNCGAACGPARGPARVRHRYSMTSSARCSLASRSSWAASMRSTRSGSSPSRCSRRAALHILGTVDHQHPVHVPVESRLDQQWHDDDLVGPAGAHRRPRASQPRSADGEWPPGGVARRSSAKTWARSLRRSSAPAASRNPGPESRHDLLQRRLARA